MWEKSCYIFLGSFWLDLALLSPKIVGNMLITNASLKILRAHCWEPCTWIILKYWDKFCICCLPRSTVRCSVKIDLWWYTSSNILSLEVVSFGVGCADLNSDQHMGHWQLFKYGCEQKKKEHWLHFWNSCFHAGPGKLQDES